MMFAELSTTGIIAARGADAAPFLQTQLTSDVAGLSELHTQYSGYCSPKGRVLATFLVWRLPELFLLQLPAGLREAVQARLKKYVLRAKVDLADATGDYRLFGVWQDTAAVLREVVTALPGKTHEVTRQGEVFVARVPGERLVVLAAAAQAARVEEALARAGSAQSPEEWSRLEIAAGIPWIATATQEAFIPQMLNLDAIGAVSYEKGCYPGQEIVARTRYLGRLKQRLYPVCIASPGAAPGDPLYSERFGPDQASGTIVNAVTEGDASRALAVVQLAAATSELRWKTPDGAAVTLGRLPYALPQ